MTLDVRQVALTVGQVTRCWKGDSHPVCLTGNLKLLLPAIDVTVKVVNPGTVYLVGVKHVWTSAFSFQTAQKFARAARQDKSEKKCLYLNFLNTVFEWFLSFETMYGASKTSSDIAGGLKIQVQSSTQN